MTHVQSILTFTTSHIAITYTHTHTWVYVLFCLESMVTLNIGEVDIWSCRLFMSYYLAKNTALDFIPSIKQSLFMFFARPNHRSVYKYSFLIYRPIEPLHTAITYLVSFVNYLSHLKIIFREF